jgi:hypothetical protein
MQRKGISKIYLIAGIVIVVCLLIAAVQLISLNHGQRPSSTVEKEPVPQKNTPAPLPSGSGSSHEKGSPERSPGG